MKYVWEISDLKRGLAVRANGQLGRIIEVSKVGDGVTEGKAEAPRDAAKGQSFMFVDNLTNLSDALPASDFAAMLTAINARPENDERL